MAHPILKTPSLSLIYPMGVLNFKTETKIINIEKWPK
jgi:hypothetical protein